MKGVCDQCKTGIDAAKNGHFSCLWFLASISTDMDATNELGESLVHVACRSGSFDCVQWLLVNGSKINTKCKDGTTPLHAAAIGGKVDCVELVVRQVDVDAQDVSGNTAAHEAARHGHIQVLETLMKKGADLELANNDGDTVCHIAAAYGWLPILQFLGQKAGVSMASKNKAGLTPCELAARGHHQSSADYLAGFSDGIGQRWLAQTLLVIIMAVCGLYKFYFCLLEFSTSTENTQLLVAAPRSLLAILEMLCAFNWHRRTVWLALTVALLVQESLALLGFKDLLGVSDSIQIFADRVMLIILLAAKQLLLLEATRAAPVAAPVKKDD
eukprot:Colp12_sorted_trinity150504_noHs@30472